LAKVCLSSYGGRKRANKKNKASDEGGEFNRDEAMFETEILGYFPEYFGGTCVKGRGGSSSHSNKLRP